MFGIVPWQGRSCRLRKSSVDWQEWLLIMTVKASPECPALQEGYLHITFETFHYHQIFQCLVPTSISCFGRWPVGYGSRWTGS
jgi:hypothetical protein